MDALLVPGFAAHSVIRALGHQAQLLSNFQYDFGSGQLTLHLPAAAVYDNAQVALLEIDLYHLVSRVVPLSKFARHAGAFYQD